jgi:hypothetical protein
MYERSPFRHLHPTGSSTLPQRTDGHDQCRNFFDEGHKLQVQFLLAKMEQGVRGHI